jgi:hypothetical protein
MRNAQIDYYKQFGRKPWKPYWYIGDDGVTTGVSRLAWKDQKEAACKTTRLLGRLVGDRG